MAEVWLRDVAEAAGVSVSAASHALKGTGNLAAGTRERIRAVAEELGYRRNPALSAIAARRWQAGGKRRYARVGFISVIQSAERMKRAGGVDQEALMRSGREYGMEIDGHTVVTSQSGLQSYIRKITRLGYDGLLLMNSDAEDWLSELEPTRLCVLGLNDLPNACPFHRMETDWGHAVRECYERLERAGCRRIGAALPKHNVRTAQERIRLGAYYSEAAGDGLAEVVPILETSLGAAEEVQSTEMLAWYRRHRPDGIVFWLPNPVYGLMKSGIAIPGELQVACINKSADPWYAPFGGVMAGATPLAEEAARLLFEMIVHRRQGRPRHPICHRLRMPWSPGERSV
ncbi:MAG: LacI family DNA-binding transcriptional regulator [Oceanipulchritudo sp.]